MLRCHSQDKDTVRSDFLWEQLVFYGIHMIFYEFLWYPCKTLEYGPRMVVESCRVQATSFEANKNIKTSHVHLLSFVTGFLKGNILNSLDWTDWTSNWTIISFLEGGCSHYQLTRWPPFLYISRETHRVIEDWHWSSAITIEIDYFKSQ